MTAHSPAGAALAAITLPSDTVGQQAIVTLDALWAAYQTTIASGRAFVGDEQPLTSVFIPRAQRYTAWLLGGG